MPPAPALRPSIPQAPPSSIPQASGVAPASTASDSTGPAPDPAARPTLAAETVPPVPGAPQEPGLALAEGRGSGEPAAPAAAGKAHSPPPAAETVRPVAAQLAEAATRLSGGGVELTLAPEELGRVRMVLGASEAGPTLTVTAERPETLDLMRRHADQLARDFRDLGFTDLTFAFAGGGQDMPRDLSAPPAPEDAAPALPEPARAPAAPPVDGPGDGRLDLRL